MMWWNNGLDTGGWILMTLGMVVFWSLIVAAGVMIFRGTRDVGSGVGGAQRTPGQMLDERFARGEIGADEYQARQDVLRSSH